MFWIVGRCPKSQGSTSITARNRSPCRMVIQRKLDGKPPSVIWLTTRKTMIINWQASHPDKQSGQPVCDENTMSLDCWDDPWYRDSGENLTEATAKGCDCLHIIKVFARTNSPPKLPHYDRAYNLRNKWQWVPEQHLPVYAEATKIQYSFFSSEKGSLPQHHWETGKSNLGQFPKFQGHMSQIDHWEGERVVRSRGHLELRLVSDPQDTTFHRVLYAIEWWVCPRRAQMSMHRLSQHQVIGLTNIKMKN